LLSANQIIQQAAQDTHAPGFVTQGLVKLQAILDELCLTEDFSVARGVYYFNLNPTLITTIAGFTNFGGPYPLPLDYLRTSGSSGEDGRQTGFFYVYNGVPYPLIPVDLGRGDMLVQQPGQQSLPYLFYTDMATETTAQDRIAGNGLVTTTLGSPTITVIDNVTYLKMMVGMGVSGLGIAAGSQIVAAPGFPTLTLSLPATGTFPGYTSSCMFGTAPNAYVWPGPSGAFPTTLRYQRLMPPIQDQNRVPWFPDQMYLLTRLAAELMATTDDQRRDNFLANSDRLLGRYRNRADDKTNRAQVVQLDLQRFRQGRHSTWGNLSNTKTTGW